MGCFLTRALQPVTLVEKSIHRERPGGLDLLNNSPCASPVSTEVTGNLITQPAQIQLVRATLQVTPQQMYSALLSEPPGFLLQPDLSFNGIKHRERMKIFWLLQLVCLAMMVYTVLVCIQVVPMERDPVLGQLLVGQDAASEQFHPEPFTLQFQNVCPEPQGSGSSHYHSHHQFLQEGTVTPKGFFPFSAEVPPPQAWPKTVWP